jgi:hypothetical protein
MTITAKQFDDWIAFLRDHPEQRINGMLSCGNADGGGLRVCALGALKIHALHIDPEVVGWCDGILPKHIRNTVIRMNDDYMSWQKIADYLTDHRNQIVEQ